MDGRLYTNPLPSLIRYKYNVREQLTASIDVSVSSGFLQYLIQDKRINSIYTTIDLFEEFKSMETHFFKLHNKHSFLPYYESLCDRIIEYSKTFADKTEERQVLGYLYTAVMSRLFALKSHVNRISVVNLVEFMKVAEFRMKNLQNSRRKTYIQQYCDDFKSAINNKIHTAFDLIESTIVPHINELHNRLRVQIQELIKEAFKRKDENQKELKKAKKNKESLEEAMKYHMISGVFATVGSILNVFVFPGFGIAANIASGAIDLIFGKGILQVIIPKNIAESSVVRIAAHVSRELHSLRHHLEATRDILHNQNLSNFMPILQKLENISIAMEPKPEYSPTGVLKFAKKSVDEIDKHLSGEITKMEESIKNDKEKNKGKVDENKLKELEQLKKGRAVLNAGSTALQVFTNMKGDQEKIDQANEIIETIEHQIELLRIHKQTIDNAVTPRLEIIEQTLTEAIRNAGNKSHVQLDISKWTIQGAMKEVKKTINEVTQTFAIAPEIRHALELLDDGITAVIDVYNLVDSYAEKKQLATLITSFAIAPNEFKDDRLKWAVFKIEKIIDANLVMEQYEATMNALKQRKFPFAEWYLDQFKLPSNSSTIDDAFTISAVDAISELIARIQQSKSLIEEIDSYLYSNYTFINDESFFHWDHFDYKDEMVNLMNGRAVLFVADINDGLKFNAIKFNEVWLNFKMINQTIQSVFDAELYRFSVVMEMVGNNFYRCNNRIYRISLDNAVRLSFTLESGRPWKVNDVYGKLKTAEPFLSPYSTWRITLISKNNDDADYLLLKEYQNYISKVSLEGRGQYLDKDAKLVYQICSDRLDKFYQLESANGISNP